MNLNQLKKFAQNARRKLITEVSARLDYLLNHDNAYIRAHQTEIAEIRRQLGKKSHEQLIEEVAYTWFNRIAALRYMDLRGYTKVRIVNPQAGQVQPELLFQIKQGRTPSELRSQQSLFEGYLNGSVGSDQPDREIYTAALLGICNDYSRTLPFLFRKVDDYMAVLLPTDLLSESSILAAVQGAIGEDDVQDVEVIGWLYQFYISEKKDQVFGRPKGEKIKKEDIPAATQLFTPHWIVRYMVENSLGRLWRNNRPDTVLAEQMEYYIEGDPEPEYLTIEGPEEITLLDPACGSGHILTYAFDLLYGMYEEAGYSAEEIPSLILTKNLYGIDIDTRAAELASFALTMKARERDRFFFKRGVVPRVIAMEDVSVDLREAGISMSPQLQEAFGYLNEATNFGSLIPVPAEVQGEIEDLLAELDSRGDADLFADKAIEQVRSGLQQLGYLARRYHCVVTNPPYMSTSNANPKLKDLVKKEYEEGKADLFAAFIVRGLRIARQRGYLGMITQHAWMFLSSHEKLRNTIINSVHISSMLHLGAHAFEGIGGEVVQTSTFVIVNGGANGRICKGVYFRLTDTEGRSKEIFFRNDLNRFRYVVDQKRFLQIPGQPIAYWSSVALVNAFRNPTLGSYAQSEGQNKTADNERFVRMWWEVDRRRVGKNSKWLSYAKGGPYRKWYGNREHVIDWSEEARKHYRINNSSRIIPEYLWYKTGITWTLLRSGKPSFRRLSADETFDMTGSSVFLDDPAERDFALAALNSIVGEKILGLLNPTLALQVENVLAVPFPERKTEYVESVSRRCQSIAEDDWAKRETSTGFKGSPLIGETNHQQTETAGTVRESYLSYASRWEVNFRSLNLLEKDNNEYFIKLFQLEEELLPGVPLKDTAILEGEINDSSLSREKILFFKPEIMRQFISYGVGCIFGRYSLDKDGLILANAGDDLATYLAQIPEPIFRPDESGILPITDDNDFADDLPSQWRAFLRAAFGDEHYDENLRFLKDGLGKRLRPYFLKGFYDDHVKRYKKRPIYWLITSPKGTLQALIYLHRYNRDTVNRFLNDYLRPYQQKLEAKRVSAEHVLTGGGSSQSEKTKAQKRIDEIRKALEELSTWERDVVRPLAENRIELDLDDGVKVNYGKLGAILTKVKGLNG